MTGKDSYLNLKQHQLPLWQELQELVDGAIVKFSVQGVQLTMPLTLTFPADMCAHWSAFKVGGGGKKPSDKVCGRCNVPYSHLGRVFDSYEVKPGDTLQTVANKHDIDVNELRTINPPASAGDAHELALSRLDYDYDCKGGHDRPQDCRCYASPRNVPVEELQDNQDILQTLEGGQPRKKKSNASANGKKKKQPQQQQRFLRVHKVHEMDRELPPEALLKAPHERCPFCMEHCVQRVVECLLRHLQDKAINEAQPKKGKSVTAADKKREIDRLNEAFYQHGCSYRYAPGRCRPLQVCSGGGVALPAGRAFTNAVVLHRIKEVCPEG